MNRILNLFLNDKNRILSACEAHVREIAAKFKELANDHNLNVSLKHQLVSLDYDFHEEQRKLRFLIREKLIHHFFVDTSFFTGWPNKFNEGINASLGVIDRSGSYSVLSFSLWSLSRTFHDDKHFTNYIGSIAESVSELLCLTIPRIYVYGTINRDILYHLVDFYRNPYQALEHPKVIEPSTWVNLYGKDISSWSAPRGSYFKNVDLSSWAITMQQLQFSFGDASVVLPGGVKPSDPSWPKHWPVWEMQFRNEDWRDSDGKIHLAAPGFLAEWRKWQCDPNSYKPPLPPSI